MSDARDIPNRGQLPVKVSHHAYARWHNRRKQVPDCGPAFAWKRAVELPRTPTLECEEARYHEPTDLVLVAEHDRYEDTLVLVTAIRGDEAHHRLRKAIEEVSE